MTKFKSYFVNTSFFLTFFIYANYALGSNLESENKIEKKTASSELSLTALDELQSMVDTMMQDTASWLDDIDTEGVKQHGGASASGYLQFGWMPRSADFSELDPKFKVRLSLPNWNDKIALVIDNNDEDELKLDYEADSINHNNESDDINLGIQYIKTLGENLNIKYRIGISRSQLYFRNEIKQHWKFDRYKLTVVPRLDYFSRDGWAPSIKGALLYSLENSMISFSASLQKVQDEHDTRQKIGLYYISKIKGDKQLVTGIQYNNDKVSNESLLLSVRHRNLIYKKWMYFELEPFIEFDQENDYKREFGIALRLIAFYGYE
jgi:hypothetical protein